MKRHSDIERVSVGAITVQKWRCMCYTTQNSRADNALLRSLVPQWRTPVSLCARDWPPGLPFLFSVPAPVLPVLGELRPSRVAGCERLDWCSGCSVPDVAPVFLHMMSYSNNRQRTLQAQSTRMGYTSGWAAESRL
jgi:hypothetical protein